jgi:hypothetical protein
VVGGVLVVVLEWIHWVKSVDITDKWTSRH